MNCKHCGIEITLEMNQTLPPDGWMHRNGPLYWRDCRIARTQAEPAAERPADDPPPCKHELMTFSRRLEADGKMHSFCAACGARDDHIQQSKEGQ